MNKIPIWQKIPQIQTEYYSVHNRTHVCFALAESRTPIARMAVQHTTTANKHTQKSTFDNTAKSTYTVCFLYPHVSCMKFNCSILYHYCSYQSLYLLGLVD